MTDAPRGIGVSPGAAVGPVVQVRPPVRPPSDEKPTTDPESEHARIKAVFESVAQTFEERAAVVDETAQQILKATALIARDKGLQKAIGKLLSAGIGPTNAVSTAVEEYAVQFEALGGYFAERVTDLKDVRNRAVARLLGQQDPGVPPLTEPSVVVARDLAPAETATLGPEHGPRDRHRGGRAHQPHRDPRRPAGHPGRRAVPGSDRHTHRHRRRRRRRHRLGHHRPEHRVRRRAGRQAATAASAPWPGPPAQAGPATGTRSPCSPTSAASTTPSSAAAIDLEGVGLFRTEFVFLSRRHCPHPRRSRPTIYADVFAPFGERRVVVRTLDAGADKPLAFADLGPEENPALGKRGLRLSADAPRAAGRAAGGAGDRRQGHRGRREGHGPDGRHAPRRPRGSPAGSARTACPRSGVMIEVPGAAIQARHVLAEVDFGSLGTNDLAQYTMAADRMEGALSDLLDPWQPAVLQVIGHACDGARLAGKPIGVCGEAGGDPLLALVLAGLGVSSLSMAPSKVSLVRFALSLHELPTCQQMAQAAQHARTAVDARDAVLAMADRPYVTSSDARRPARRGPAWSSWPGSVRHRSPGWSWPTWAPTSSRSTVRPVRRASPTPRCCCAASDPSSPTSSPTRAASLVLDLAGRADLLVEGFRPGVMERLGLGPEDCHARNPRLVYGRLTGWGQSGPLARYAGHDLNYIAPTGALAAIVRDEADGRIPRPVPPSVLVGDLAGGSLHLVIGLLAALHNARATGAGQVVDAAIVDGTAYLTTFARALEAVGLWNRPAGHNILDTGAPFFEVYECADQRHLAIGALEDHFYAELLRLLDLGLPEDDPRHPSRRSDPSGWPDAKARWARLFATRTRDEWCALLEHSDACVSPVLTRTEASSHPHAAAREGYVQLGEHLLPAPAPRFTRTPAGAGRPTTTGADTDSVLRELGYDDGQIAAIRA